LVTIILWASAFPAIRVVVAAIGPTALSLGRLLIASLALAAVAPFAGLRRPRAVDVPLFLFAGAAGMTAYQLLLNRGEENVPAGTASLLVATTPIFSMLLANVTLHEKVGVRRLAGSLIGLLGAGVIAVGRGHGFALDVAAVLVLVAAAVQAVYHAAQKPLLARYTGFEVVAYAMWAGTLLMLPFGGALIAEAGNLDWTSGLALLFLGLGPSALGFFTWAYALSRVEVSYATASLYLVPAFAIIVAFVTLGEEPGGWELCGGALTIVGVAMANRFRLRSRGPRPAGEDAGEDPAAMDVEGVLLANDSRQGGDSSPPTPGGPLVPATTKNVPRTSPG
jgi:drug/metabolite transporter (DMT)-like permease